MPGVALFALLVSGCEAPGPTGESGPSGTQGGWLEALFSPSPAQDDVIAIRQFYNPLPWLRDADGRISGFYTRAYFVSARTNKGVFVRGPITVTLSRLRPRATGGYDRELVHEWTLDEEAARGFRVVKTSRLGDSYGFALQWPPEVDVMGRRVEIAFAYQRADGRVIRGVPRQLFVPVPPGFAPPRDPEPAAPTPDSATRPTPPRPAGARPS